MVYKYLKLGITNNDRESVVKDVERILQISFERRESSYWGEYYIAKIDHSQGIQLTYNFIDEGWQEEEYQDCPLLLSIDELAEPEREMWMICNELRYIKPLYMTEVEPNVFFKKYLFQDGVFKLESEYHMK
ncbi:hypothetical protein WD019_14480 [Fictibacillus sp. Mic-4]|uniref:hypothetical protein n=1 Tax=Fictibacillus TaxID=1329200 RepID=UPI000427E286|nr:hypothetical protein [Fictibacillus gelatini]